MAQWANLQRIRKFVNQTRLYVTCEKSGGLHLVEPGLRAGWLAGGLAGRRAGLQAGCRAGWPVGWRAGLWSGWLAGYTQIVSFAIITCFCCLNVGLK